MGIRDLLVLMAGYGCMPVALYNAYLGLLAYCWLSLMRPQSLVWSTNVRAARITMAVAVVLVIRALFTHGPKIRFRASTVAFLALWAWLGVCTLYSTHVDSSSNDLLQFSKVGVAAVLITGLVRTRSQFKWLMVVLAMCPGIWAAKFGQFFLRGVPSSQDGAILGLDNNDVALFIAMSIPMLAFCAHEIKSRWGRRVLYASSMLAVPGVILTTSRGGMLAMATAVALTLLRKTAWWKAGVLGLAAFGVTWMLIPAKTLDRYRSIESYRADVSARGRMEAWQTAMAMAERNPWTGVGFGQEAFLAEYQYYRPTAQAEPRAAHSVWFSLMGETGYMGLGLYITLLLTVLHATARVVGAARMTPPGQKNWAWSYAVAIQSSLLTFMVGGSFLSQARFEYVYLLALASVPLLLLAEEDPALGPHLTGEVRSVGAQGALALTRSD